MKHKAIAASPNSGVNILMGEGVAEFVKRFTTITARTARSGGLR